MLPALASGLREGGRFDVLTLPFGDAGASAAAQRADALAVFYGMPDRPLQTALQALAPAEWYERYAKRVENYRLPKTDVARQDLARVRCAHGCQHRACPVDLLAGTVDRQRQQWRHQWRD